MHWIAPAAKDAATTSIVRLLVEILEPFHGRILDPRLRLRRHVGPVGVDPGWTARREYPCGADLTPRGDSDLTQRRGGAETQKGAEGMTENEIATIVVESAVEVHRTLGGPGLLELVYEEALAFEVESRGLTVQRQKPVPLVYKGRRLASDLRLDLLVNERVVVECKATVAYNRLFEAQVLTYLRLCDLRLGLVINFGERLVRQGIHRVVNGLEE